MSTMPPPPPLEYARPGNPFVHTTYLVRRKVLKIFGGAFQLPPVTARAAHPSVPQIAVVTVVSFWLVAGWVFEKVSRVVSVRVRRAYVSTL